MQYQPMYGSFGHPPQPQPQSNKVASSGANEESLATQYSSSSPTNTTATSTSASSMAASNSASNSTYTLEDQKSDPFSAFRLESIFLNDPTETTSQQTNTNVNSTDSFDLRYPTDAVDTPASASTIDNPNFDSDQSLPFYRTNVQSNSLFSSFQLSSPQDILASLANVPIFNQICNFNPQANNSQTNNRHQQQQHEESETIISNASTTPSIASTSSPAINDSNTISSLLNIINNTGPTSNNTAPTTLNAIMTTAPVSTTLETGASNNGNSITTNLPSASSSTASLTAPSALPPLNTTPIVITPLMNTSSRNQTYLLATKKPMKGSTRPFRERAPWTSEEDNLLKLAVQLYGDKTEKWSKIAACVPGRTNKNCRKRWFHSLDPSLRKGTWTEEEDQLLREGVSKFPNQWSRIAELLPGRTDDQCAKRWRESLDPSIDRSEWTAAEDKLLMEKYEEYGSQWQKIANFFDGRPGLHCRNRWRKLQRLEQAKRDKENNRNNDSGQPPRKKSAILPQQDKDSDSFFNTLSTEPFRLLRAADDHSATNNTSNSIMTALLTSSQSASQQQSSLIESLTIAQHIASNMPKSKLYTADTTPSLEEIHDESGNLLKPYGCDVPDCHSAFSTSHLLYSHVKQHVSLQGIEKPFRCAMLNCNKKYKNINGLQYHIKEAKGKKGHQGVFVVATAHSSSSSAAGNSRRPQQLVGNNSNNTTDDSTSNNTGDESSQKPANVEDERPYRCNIDNCNKAYRTASGFRYHQANGHNSDNAKQRRPKKQSFQQQQQPPFRFLKRERWVMESA